MQGPDTEAQDHPPFVQIRLATHGRSIQMCHLRHFALQQNSEPFRHRTTAAPEADAVNPRLDFYLWSVEDCIRGVLFATLAGRGFYAR
jgi:hypothetical protein